MRIAPETQDDWNCKTIPAEISFWMDTNNLRNCNYDERGNFRLIYDLDRRNGDFLVFEEYDDSIAEIYSPDRGMRQLRMEVPKDAAAMFVDALKGASNVQLGDFDGITKEDLEDMDDIDLMELAVEYYNKIKDQDMVVHDNELKRNYNGKVTDYTGKWHKASEELTEEERYL